MKYWRVEVFVTIHGQKSACGNWYEGTFKTRRWAYFVARWMAFWCDLRTPNNNCCWNICWLLSEIEEVPCS